MPPNSSTTHVTTEAPPPASTPTLEENLMKIAQITRTRGVGWGIGKGENGGRQRQPLIWRNVILITALHAACVYAVLFHVQYCKWQTVVWGFVCGGLAGFGVTAGAHRLWCHRSYKAKLPLQIILLVCYAVAGQNTVYDWVRDHRVHHKFSETDADPHNSARGFFFSHVGWLMQKKHPQVYEKGKTVDMSDILNDPLLKFFNKYFPIFKMLFCFVLPVLPPIYFWNESVKIAVTSQIFVRYVVSLNSTWAVNSFAHIWGSKPYDKRIQPVENVTVAIFAMGEGWHNYHHVFPWDYKAAELGNYKFNVTTMWLDFFAKIGWAYDLKTPSDTLVHQVINRYGDGSHAEIPQPTESPKMK